MTFVQVVRSRKVVTFEADLGELYSGRSVLERILFVAHQVLKSPSRSFKPKSPLSHSTPYSYQPYCQ